MGRAKLDMELIRKEKSRSMTFKKRKEGLIRKLHELTTLCDVRACMIIYGPKQENEPDIWPQNLDQVHRLIDTYKAHNKDSGIKTFGLSDFFKERKKKVVYELARMRKKNMELKYSTWPQFLDLLTEGQLREFAIALINKAEYVKSRIGLLKSLRSPVTGTNLMDMGQVFYFYGASSSMDGLGAVDPMMCQVPWPLVSYYAPPPLPYMVAPPEVQLSRWENYDQNIFQYQMKLCEQPVQFYF